jgi:hypothetical protein
MASLCSGSHGGGAGAAGHETEKEWQTERENTCHALVTVTSSEPEQAEVRLELPRREITMDPFISLACSGGRAVTSLPGAGALSSNLTLEAGDAQGSSDWWLADSNGLPIGPMSTDLLGEWVRAGLVVSGAFVCRTGSVDWQPISDVAPFAVVAGARARRFDPAKELCVIDIEALPPARRDTGEYAVGVLPPAPRNTGEYQSLDPASEVTAVAVPRPSRPPVTPR